MSIFDIMTDEFRTEEIIRKYKGVIRSLGRPKSVKEETKKKTKEEDVKEGPRKSFGLNITTLTNNVEERCKLCKLFHKEIDIHEDIKTVFLGYAANMNIGSAVHYTYKHLKNMSLLTGELSGITEEELLSHFLFCVCDKDIYNMYIGKKMSGLTISIMNLIGNPKDLSEYDKVRTLNTLFGACINMQKLIPSVMTILDKTEDVQENSVSTSISHLNKRSFFNETRKEEDVLNDYLCECINKDK